MDSCKFEWYIIQHNQRGTTDVLSTFRIARELATDGGPLFQSIASFLRKWDIRRRLSSAYYPQINGRAEAGITAKRILLGNVEPKTGKLENNMAVKALLTHRNTPSQQTGVLPAMALFLRPIPDHLPLHYLHLLNDKQITGNMSGKSKHRAFDKHPKGPKQLQHSFNHLSSAT